MMITAIKIRFFLGGGGREREKEGIAVDSMWKSSS
jgi:hypothetical protein